MFVVYLKMTFNLIASVNELSKVWQNIIYILYSIHNTCTIPTTEFYIWKDYNDVTFRRENTRNSETLIVPILQQELKNLQKNVERTA